MNPLWIPACAGMTNDLLILDQFGSTWLNTARSHFAPNSFRLHVVNDKLLPNQFQSSRIENIRADIEPYLLPRTVEQNFEHLFALCQFGVDVYNSLAPTNSFKEFEDPRTRWYSDVIARFHTKK
jgi:hypothetical protein